MRWLYLLWVCVILSLGGLAPAATASPAAKCDAVNLLDRLAQTDPDALRRIRQEAKDIRHARAVLWKINGQQDQKPSWLFGTIHVADERITKLPAAVRRAMENAAVIAVEAAGTGNPQRIAAALQRNLHLVRLQGAETLWDLFDEADENRIRQALKAAKIPPLIVTKSQPWLVASFLVVPGCEQARKTAGTKVMDVQIEEFAYAQKTPLIALETIAEQFAAFNAMPLELQRQFLLEAVYTRDQTADRLETMIQLYLRGEMHLVYPWSRYEDTRALNVTAQQEITGHFNQILVSRRNKLMFKRSKSLVEAGGAFIAVGALHLQGDDGLVAQFKQHGYDVVPVH